MRSVARLSCLLAGTVACAVGVAPSAAQPPAVVAPSPRAKRLNDAEIAGLIARVGSPSYAEREAATEALRRAPEAKGAMTRALAATTNPEVARRLNWALEVQRRDWANARLAKLPEYVRRKQFDRLVETMVACREHLTEEHDKHIRAFIDGVYADATGGKDHPFTSGKNWCDFDSFAWSQRLDGGAPSGRIGSRPNVIARHVARTGISTSVAASDRVGPPHTDGGPIGTIPKCVVLCNGDVEAFCADDSIIIATGTVSIGGLYSCVVVCLGDVLTGRIEGSVVAARGRVDRSDGVPEQYENILRERDAAFFRDWKMFSHADIGANLISLFGAVRVTTVDPGSPFDRAGLRPGDRLTRVDDTPVRSVRDAHRLLCRAAVTRGDASLTLVRGTSPRTAVVAIQSWD